MMLGTAGNVLNHALVPFHLTTTCKASLPPSVQTPALLVRGHPRILLHGAQPVANTRQYRRYVLCTDGIWRLEVVHPDEEHSIGTGQKGSWDFTGYRGIKRTIEWPLSP